MKPKFLYFFLFIFFSVSFVSATIIPNQLQINFDLVSGESICKSISLSSNEPASAIIKDVWAEEYNKERSLDRFAYSAKDHGLEINYKKSLEFTEPDSIDVDICIKASNIGKYQGALIFSSENKTGNVLQYSTWLRVIVSEKPIIQNTISGGSGGSDGSGISETTNSSNLTDIQLNNETLVNKTENLIYDDSESNEGNENNVKKTNGISGLVIGKLGTGELISMGILVFIMSLIIFGVYKRKSKNEKI